MSTEKRGWVLWISKEMRELQCRVIRVCTRQDSQPTGVDRSQEESSDNVRQDFLRLLYSKKLPANTTDYNFNCEAELLSGQDQLSFVSSSFLDTGDIRDTRFSPMILQDNILKCSQQAILSPCRQYKQYDHWLFFLQMAQMQLHKMLNSVVCSLQLWLNSSASVPAHGKLHSFCSGSTAFLPQLRQIN